MHLLISIAGFVLAVTLLGYVPGRLALGTVRAGLPRLDTVTLSLALGLVVSGSVYWILGCLGLQRFLVIWALAMAIALAKQLRGKGTWPRGSMKGAHALLAAGVLVGATVLRLLPLYDSNLTLTKQGAMRVCPLIDGSFHIAVVSELTHSVPPQNPLFAGRPLSYHVGSDLPAAMFASVPGLDMVDLTLRLVPTLFLAMTMLAVFCCARLWLASDYGAALVALLVVFGEDFSFVPGVLQRSASDWSTQYFGVPSTFSLFCVNPILPAVGLLFLGLYCLMKSAGERPLAWQLLTGVLIAALAACKIFTAVHLWASLALAGAIYFFAFRNGQMCRSALVAAICMAPVLTGIFVSNHNGGQVTVRFFEFRTLAVMAQQLGLTSHLAWLSPPLLFAAGITIYLVGSLGLRCIGAPLVIRELLRPRQDTSVRYAVAVFVVTGIVLGLTVTLVPRGVPDGYDNGVWFYVHSKYVAWLFAAEAVVVSLRGRARSRVQGALIVAVLVAASVPATIQHFAYFRSAYKPVLLSPDSVAVLRYLRKASHPGAVVVSPDELLGPVLAVAKCHVPVGSCSNYMVPIGDWRRRTADLSRFWSDWRNGRTRDDILRLNGVEYLVASRSQGQQPAGTQGLTPAFGNAEWIVYRVAGARGPDQD